LRAVHMHVIVTVLYIRVRESTLAPSDAMHLVEIARHYWIGLRD